MSPVSSSDFRQPRQVIQWSLIWLFVLLAAGITVFGLQLLRHRQALSREIAHHQLEAIADLKIQQIVHWRGERLRDGQLILSMRNAEFEALEALEQGDIDRSRLAFENFADPLLTAGPYGEILLLGTNLSLLLAHPRTASRTMVEPALDLARQAMLSGEVTVSDLHQEPGGPIHLGLIVPLPARDSGLGTILADGEPQPPFSSSRGVLLLKVNAKEFLFPLLASWPTLSQTAETLLVRRDGNQVLFLNELRHRSGTALSLRRPLGETELPAAKGLRGEEGITGGIDYRGIRVVADVRAVPGTPWVMVAKIDEDELYAPLRQEAAKVGAVTISLLLATSLGIAVLWRRRSEQLLRAQLAERQRSEDALRESEERYKCLFELESDAIVLVDNESGRVLEANQAACSLYGYSRDEWLRMKHTDVSAEPQETRRAAVEGITSIPVRWHRKRDGTVFPVEITGTHFQWQGRKAHIAAIRDITARMAVERHLRESQRRLSTLLAHLPGMAYRCRNDKQWTMEIVSQGCLGLTGYEDTELVENARIAFADLIHPDDRAKVYLGVESALAAGRHYELQYRIVTRSGDEKWIWERGVGVATEQGEVMALEGFITDVTAQKQVEEALQRSERNYREIFDATTEAIFLDDAATGRMLDVNEAMLRMYGYETKAEVLAGNIEDLSAGEPPYTEAEAQRRIRLAIEEGPQVFEWLARRKNGEQFWTEVSLRSSQIGGEGRILAVVRDITDRKRAEQALTDEHNLLRTLVDNLPDMVFTKGIDGKFTSSNLAANKFKGISERDIVGKSVFDLNPSDLAYRYADDDARVLRGETLPNREELIVDHSGVSHWHLTTKAPLRDAKGRIAGLVAICRNIDDRKRADEALRLRTAELEARNEQLDRFNRLAVGRELRMIELKREVNELCRQTGRKEQYKLVPCPGMDDGDANSPDEHNPR